MGESGNNLKELSLGERMRGMREQAGMSVEEAARKIKISSRYVSALEEENWAVFSAKVYAQGTARRITHIFDDTDADALIASCGREWDIVCASTGGSGKRARRALARPGRFTMTPRRIGIAAAISGAMLVTAFFSMRLITFIAAPGLVIESPLDQSGFTAPLVQVAGKTEKESSLTVNGRELTLDGQGNFDEKIELPPGPVTLHFISRNRFGSTQTVIRNILVK